jgi:hypothetical protein
LKGSSGSGAVGSEWLAEERSCGIEATRQAATIDVNGGMLIR